jgi:uncharacterized protein YgiM (DUF1202 family)
MYRKKFFSMMAMIFLISASACSLPVGTGGLILTNPTATVPLDTQVAQLVAATEAAQTAIAYSSASTLTALSTETPQATFTPSLTPTLTFTLTPKAPMVSVSVDTNCRRGPGDSYSISGVLAVGQTAEVVGQSPANNNWIIKLTSAGPTCWIWAQYATVTGNTSGLPIVTPPPTPTPPAAFQVSYATTQICPSGFGLKFLITNTGHTSWESNQVNATNLSTHVTKTSTYDTFPNYSSTNCSLLDSSLNLDPGETGTTSVFGFTTSPSGKNFSATIEVCSQNGLAGVCLNKTITFTAQ